MSQIPEHIRSNIEALASQWHLPPETNAEALSKRDGRALRLLISSERVDDIVTIETWERCRELLGIVHRPNARYSAQLQKWRIPIGNCRRCEWTGPVHETVLDPEYGEVHVHREPRGHEVQAVIDRLAVFARDKWTCRLCARPLDRRRHAPDPWTPSVDHIIPVALGGRSESGNLQSTHLRCNILKGVQPVVGISYRAS